MSKTYLKPKAELISFDLDDAVMDNLPDDSWDIGEDEEEGI